MLDADLGASEAKVIEALQALRLHSGCEEERSQQHDGSDAVVTSKLVSKSNKPDGRRKLWSAIMFQET